MIAKLGKIEIDVPDCPAHVPNVNGIPSWVVGWGMGVGFVVVVCILFLIYCLAELRKEHAADRRRADIDMAKLHKACDTCGTRYEPDTSKW
jgi:hypothetical protein